MKNVIKAAIIATTFIGMTNLAVAADNKKVGECIIVASVAQNQAAAQRALALADNQRVALAEADNVMDRLKRLPQKERQSLFDLITGSCASLGIRLSK